MCGLAGELGSTAGPPTSPRCERMSGCLAPRGPDGSRDLGPRTGRARPPAAVDHRPQRGRLAADDRPRAGLQRGVQRLHLQLPAAPRRAGDGRLHVLLHLRHRGDRQGVRPVGRRLRRATSSGCSPSPRTSTRTGRLVLGRDRLGIKPLYLDQTRDRLRFASTLPALLAGGGTDTSIDPTALAYYMSFHSVVPAPRTILNGIRKLPPATVRVVEPDGTHSDWLYWEPEFSRDPDAGRLDRAGLGGGAARPRCAPRSTGGWWPTCRSACCCPAASTPAWSWRCWPRPASTVCRPSASGSTRPAVSPATSSSTRSLVAERFGTDHHQIPIPSSRLLPGHRRGDRGDERADGQPRLRRVLPAQPGGRQERQGRAVRSGRGRGARRLRLVPAAGLGRRARTPWRRTRSVFFDRRWAGSASC